MGPCWTCRRPMPTPDTQQFPPNIWDRSAFFSQPEATPRVFQRKERGGLTLYIWSPPPMQACMRLRWTYRRNLPQTPNNLYLPFGADQHPSHTLKLRLPRASSTGKLMGGNSRCTPGPHRPRRRAWGCAGAPAARPPTGWGPPTCRCPHSWTGRCSCGRPRPSSAWPRAGRSGSCTSDEGSGVWAWGRPAVEPRALLPLCVRGNVRSKNGSGRGQGKGAPAPYA